MIDFMNTDKAKGIIDQYLTKGVYTAPPDINPVYDVREPGQEFPPLNPPINVTPDADDPCPQGYMLVDGVCQPISDFGGSSVVEEVSGGGDDDMEERPYMSIEDMKSATDEKLLEYLTSGFLKNSPLGFLPSKGTEVTLGMGTLPPLFQLAFGGQNEMRKNFILGELANRGYFTGNFDNNNNPIFDIGNKNINTNPLGIESALPQNTMGQPVTDVFGDTYQQVTNDNQGNTGYTFTSGNPQDSVGQETQSGVVYGLGRGSGGNSGGSGVVVNTSGSGNPFTGSFNPITNREDDYDDESSGI